MTEPIQMPHGRVFTAADLEGMPGDGNRSEIVLLVASRESLAGRNGRRPGARDRGALPRHEI